MAAAVATASVAAFMTMAVMPVFMVVMMTFRIRIVGKIALQEGSHLSVRVAAGPGIKLYARLGQRVLGSGPDTAADEHVHAPFF